MTLVDRLNKKHATPETILETVKTAVFEVSGDLHPRAMRQKLEAELGQEVVVDALAILAADPALVEEAALAWLAFAQEDVGSMQVVDDALDTADRSLPIFETGAITLVVLYAIYAFARVPKRQVHKIEYKADGRYIESKETLYDSFSEPLRGLLALSKFTGHKTEEQSGPLDK